MAVKSQYLDTIGTNHLIQALKKWQSDKLVNYVTINTAQTITGTKTFQASIKSNTSGANIEWGNIKVFGAGSNGGSDSIRIGDDVTIGDCDVSGSFGMVSTGANAGFRFFNSSKVSIGGIQSTNGTLQWFTGSELKNILHAGNSYIQGSTITINGSSITPLTSLPSHTHDYLTVNAADINEFNSSYHDFQVLYAGGGNGIEGRPAGVDAFGLFRFRVAYGWSGQMLLANGGDLYIRSAADADLNRSLAWKRVIDSGNIGSQSVNYATLSSRTKFLETFRQDSTTDTYGASYPIWAQWANSTNVRLKCTDYTVWIDKADYATSAGNTDTVDGYHANGLLTDLSNSDKGISITVGGTTKSVSNINVNGANTILGISPQIAAATEYNSIYVSSPSYSTYKPVKMLCFDWYGNYWAFSNIRSGDEHSAGFGVFFKNTEIARFTSDGNLSCNAASATKLTSSAGSATVPIYFSDGKPVACTMSTGRGDGITLSFCRGAYTSANQYFGNGTIVAIDPKGEGCISENDTILSLGDLSIRNTQLLVAYDRDGVYYRRITDSLNYGDWKRLAFTTDNVDSATKLETARSIWGQSFDGTGNVDNTLRIRNTTSNYCEGIRIQNGDNTWATIILGATSDSGTNANAWSIHRKADNNFAISRNSSDGTNGLVMTSVGMGLGTTAPTQRLDVAGNIRATGQLFLPTNGNYNAILMGDDCWMGDCNIGDVIGLSGRNNANAGGIKFGKGGMYIGYNGSSHYSSDTSLWSNFNADLLDGYHADNIQSAGWRNLYRIGGSSNVIKWTRIGRCITTAGDNAQNDGMIEFHTNGDQNYKYFGYGRLQISQYGQSSRSLMLQSFTSEGIHFYATIDADNYIWLGHNAWWSGNSAYRVIWSGSYIEWYSSGMSMQTSNPNSVYVTDNGTFKKPNETGFVCLNNVYVEASKLKTGRSIWGNLFDGTRDISGLITLGSGNHIGIKISNTYIDAIDQALIIHNNSGGIRFGNDAWDWNQWAGLKYVHGSRLICLGIAEGSDFTASSNLDNGTLRLSGITTLQFHAAEAHIGHSRGYSDPWRGLNANFKFDGVLAATHIYSNGGFHKNGSNDSYVLLGGGGHALIGNLASWSSRRLLSNSEFVKGDSFLQYFNFVPSSTSAIGNAGPSVNEWYHIIRMNHANDAGFFVELAAHFYDKGVFYRSVSNGSVNTNWRRFLTHNGNVAFTSFNTYYEDGVFDMDGNPSGASGLLSDSWNQTIVNLGASYSKTRIKQLAFNYSDDTIKYRRRTDSGWTPARTIAFLDSTVAASNIAYTLSGKYTKNGGQQPPKYFGRGRVGALMMNTIVNGNGHYKDWLLMDCYNYDDVGGGVAFGVNRQALGAYIMRSNADRGSWVESAELVGTHNFRRIFRQFYPSGGSDVIDVNYPLWVIYAAEGSSIPAPTLSYTGTDTSTGAPVQYNYETRWVPIAEGSEYCSFMLTLVDDANSRANVYNFIISTGYSSAEIHQLSTNDFSGVVRLHLMLKYSGTNWVLYLAASTTITNPTTGSTGVFTYGNNKYIAWIHVYMNKVLKGSPTLLTISDLCNKHRIPGTPASYGNSKPITPYFRNTTANPTSSLTYEKTGGWSHKMLSPCPIKGATSEKLEFRNASGDKNYIVINPNSIITSDNPYFGYQTVIGYQGIESYNVSACSVNTASLKVQNSVFLDGVLFGLSVGVSVIYENQTIAISNLKDTIFIHKISVEPSSSNKTSTILLDDTRYGRMIWVKNSTKDMLYIKPKAGSIILAGRNYVHTANGEALNLSGAGDGMMFIFCPGSGSIGNVSYTVGVWEGFKHPRDW